MYAWVLMSRGIEIPRWEQYLPCGITQIQFFGEDTARKSVLEWAASFGITEYTDTMQHPDIVIAFWNGMPDFVDDTVDGIATTIREMATMDRDEARQRGELARGFVSRTMNNREQMRKILDMVCKR